MLGTHMVGIIVGTNRRNSRTAELARYYAQALKEKYAEDSFIVDLAELPEAYVSGQMYGKPKDEGFTQISDQLASAGRTVWIVPEYNNSIPGVLKSYLDSFPFPNPLIGGVAALVGLSAGSNGGANALSHLADILGYLGLVLVPQRLRLYSLEKNWRDGTLQEPMLLQIMHQQMESLLRLGEALQPIPSR